MYGVIGSDVYGIQMAFHKRLELGRTKAVRRARSFLALNHDHDDLGVTVSLNHQDVCALLPLRFPLDTRVTIPSCRGYAPSDAAICAIELRPCCDPGASGRHSNAQQHLTHAEKHVRAWEERSGTGWDG
ncbi:hypothetical protein K523DRAFT_307731 [Schizophyllum commune Tattone D]|nr:hypothetical protein K523DRAFT_307731 [Schizophyllum commune Tattone D]